jgi:hypothetical protein
MDVSSVKFPIFEDAVTWIIYVSNPKGLPKVAVVV